MAESASKLCLFTSMHDYENNVLRVQLYLLHFLRFNSYERMAESASKDVDVMSTKN
jgi:hypothetical protein